MKSRSRFLLGAILFLCVVILVTAPCHVPAQTAQKSEIPEKTIDTQAKDKTQAPVIKVKAMDKAGESVGKGIDKLSHSASSKFGKWIEVEIFAGITWLKLLFCLFLTFLVVIVERLLRWLINATIRKIPSDIDVVSWQRHFLLAFSKPLSLFIWSYGIYGALSPLYSHFRTPVGENLVHLVAQKAADVGGTIALFWFILSLVQILDVYLKKWAAGTESTIDDMLVPIVAKTLKVFIIVIGGIIVIQKKW